MLGANAACNQAGAPWRTFCGHWERKPEADPIRHVRSSVCKDSRFNPRDTSNSTRRSWLAELIGQRSVQAAAAGWVLANVVALVLGRGVLPFDRPRMAGATALDQVISANPALLEVFFLMAVVWFLTRKRAIPDLASRVPARATALHETVLLLGYGALCLVTAVLVPRYLKLTGSATAITLGGLTYTAMHLWDSWTALSSPRHALLSLIVLVMIYFGPGMMKSYLTVRTGNAWVHLWAYHAIAPHTLLDTPLLVRTFGIR